MRYLILSGLFAFFLSSCWNIKKGEPIKGVAPGLWKGVFKLNRQNVPVLYEVKNSNNAQPLELSFQTGEHILNSDTAYLFGDTLFAMFEQTQRMLKVVYQIDQMNGYLYDNTNSTYPIEFSGIKGPRHRFPDIREQPLTDITGEWHLTANAQENSSTTIALRLAVDKNQVTGTLQLPTRKKGYPLEGTVQGDKLYLSGFDGACVLWLHAHIENHQTLNQGSLRINEESFFWEANRKAGTTE